MQVCGRARLARRKSAAAAAGGGLGVDRCPRWQLLDDPDVALVDDLAASLGLCRVGWIFTDLETEDPQAATVKHKRFVTCVASSG